MIHKSLNIFSMCDGMSCGQIALTELGYSIKNYWASEIDKNSIKVTMDNFPNTKQIGDVNDITLDYIKTLPTIDLVLFGSPCRSLSKATAGREEYNNGLKGISGLFYICYRVLTWIQQYNNPNVLFLVENVDSYNTVDLDIISETLGVEPIMINSSLFSAQDRKRLYWTNIYVDDISNNVNNNVIKDILDDNVDTKYFYDEGYTLINKSNRICATLQIKGHDIIKRVYNINYKSPTLTSCRGGNHQVKILINDKVRKLTPSEYRKLQTIPSWYKTDIADTHIYNMCGDGWTVNVIKHIFKGIEKSIDHPNNGTYKNIKASSLF